MRDDDDVYTIQAAFPRIWHACHKRHRRGATDDDAPSERDSSILAHLDAERAVAAGALARHLGVAASTLSEAMDDLEHHGFLTREKAPRDKRVVLVRLTRKGKDAVATDAALDGARLTAVLARLGKKERAAAAAGLAILGRAAMQMQASRRVQRRRSS